MGELIDALLTLSRLGRKEIEVLDIDMTGIVKDFVMNSDLMLIREGWNSTLGLFLLYVVTRG